MKSSYQLLRVVLFFLLLFIGIPLYAAEMWSIAHSVSMGELQQSPEVVSVYLYQQEDSVEPIQVQHFEQGQWRSDTDLSNWSLPEEQFIRFQVQMKGMGLFDSNTTLWAELEVDGARVSERFKARAPAPNVSVEGYVESRTIGFKFPDESVQTTAMNAVCPEGQYLRSIDPDGNVICEVDQDTNSGGTVTSITAGAGLDGGVITESGIIDVVAGGISEGMLAEDAVTSSKIIANAVGSSEIAPNAVGADELADGAVIAVKVDSSQVQYRVSGVCGVGQVITAINADGSVSCGYTSPEHKRIVIVSPVGSSFDNGAALLSAIAGISPTANEPYMLKIEPGVYDVGPNQVSTKDYLDVEGSGQTSTRIKGNYLAAGSHNGFVQVVSNSELRMLTVENYGGGSNSYTGIHVWNEANVRISDVTVLVHSGTLVHTGIDLDGQGTVLRNVTVIVTGGSDAVGLRLSNSNIVVGGAYIRAVDGSHSNYGVISDSPLGRTIMNSIIEASGAASSTNTGFYNYNGSDPDIFNCIIRAFGATYNYAIHNIGAFSEGGEIEIHNSRLSGGDWSVVNESSNNTYMAASQLKGPVINNSTGIVKCVGSYNQDFNPLNSSCSP